MSEGSPPTQPVEAVTIYCSQCGQAMRVMREHVSVPVACPHCQTALEPWRALDAPTSAAPPGTPVAGHQLVSSKNKIVAGLLGIFLGSFGIHRFYLGFNGIGLIQLLLTVGSCFYLSPVVGIWGLVEGILCFTGTLTDADGLPLRD